MVFKRGDRVKCIKDFGGPQTNRPNVGETYTIRQFVCTTDYGQSYSLLEFPNHFSFAHPWFELVSQPHRPPIALDVADWRLWQMSMSDNTCRCGAPKPCEYHP